MSKQYETFKKYQVDAENVEDFLERYTKRDRHLVRGKEYVQARIESHEKDLEKYGFTFITSHDSVTGDIVAYYK
jgi:hypothetical protein